MEHPQRAYNPHKSGRQTGPRAQMGGYVGGREGGKERRAGREAGQRAVFPLPAKTPVT